MKYMLLIYATESSWTEDERKECMIESMGISKELEKEGKWIAASPLHSVTTATSVRVRDGKKLLQESRHSARLNASGDIVLLEDQDRTTWHQDLIAEGKLFVEQSLRSRRFGVYTI